MDGPGPGRGSKPFVRNHISRPKLALPSSLRVLARLAVATLAAAGCAAKAPHGTLQSLDFKAPLNGYVMATYQPFTGANPTSSVPTAGPMTECSQSNLPAQAQPTTDPYVPQCNGPYTIFPSHASLPDPSADGYKLYAVGPGFELEAFSFKGSGGSYAGPAPTTAGLPPKVKKLQIRVDGVTLAVAPGTAGNQTFTLAPALAALSVSGTYTGHHLEVT